MTPEENFNENEIVEKMKAKIAELKKEDLAIDLCRGKGVSLDKSEEIGDRQREIEKELSQLKSQLPKFKPKAK
jgi:predicted methyltransferase